MKNIKRFSFSLLTAFLVLTIAALSASHVAMMRRLQRAREETREARAEVEAVRREFGYIHADDPTLIYVSRIEGSESRGTSYRMRIPPGHRLMLNIADTEFSVAGEPANWKPTKSMSMNSWRDGADVILRWGVFRDEDKIPRLEVWTDSEPLFDYRLEGWEQPKYPNSGSDLGDGQQSFAPDETMRFMAFWNDETKRGVMLWMEPTQQWLKRRTAGAR